MNLLNRHRKNTKKHLNWKYTTPEMKNMQDSINSRLNFAKKDINASET